MRDGSRGYTLVEVLVATAVFAVFMIGMLNLLDTSTRVSETEKQLADTQENVRFAAYHIMRTARMMGGARMPFADNGGGTPRWVAGGVVNNASGTYTTPFGTSVNVLEGSDILLLRGFFEVPPFFIDRSDFKISTMKIEVNETASVQDGRSIINPIGDLSADPATGDVSGLAGRGLLMMGNLDQGQYTVGEIGSGATLSGTVPNRKLEIPVVSNASTAAWWTALRPAGATVPPPYDVYRIGILESYVYYVSENFELRRVRADSTGASDQPVAVNVGGLQIALGPDLNGDGLVDAGEWQITPTLAGSVGQPIIAMRITVLGRTPNVVRDWTEPATTFAVEDLVLGTVERGAKWRRLQVAATLRNFLF
jgi:prepilin-type N-terminal cleavage/methylation domain-containing protein